jgi:hypothetical protein
MPLDAPPSTGKIRIIGWQGQKRVQMFGKDDNRIDRERSLAARGAKRITKQAYMIHKHARASIRKRNREEKRCAGEEVAPVIDHDEMIAWIPPARETRQTPLFCASP